MRASRSGKPFAAAATGALIALSLFTLCQPAGAVTVMALNAEWFWDSNPPHEGRIAIGPAGSPPSRMQVQVEAYAIALRILQQDPDIVALTEVENENVVRLVRDWLGSNWRVVWKKGRDNITGQDVAILTCLSVQAGTVSKLRDIKKGTALNGETSARPSKALAVLLRDGDTTHLVIALHLVSKRGDNDDKREAQAAAVRNYLRTAAPKADSVIILGDLNDTPDSNTLAVLQGSHDDGVKLFQSSKLHGSGDEWSYEYEGERQLIDHILITKPLQQSGRFFTVDLGPISDHRAVVGVYD